MTEKATLNWMLARIKEAEKLSPKFNRTIAAIGQKARLEIERLNVEDHKNAPGEKEPQRRIQYRGNMFSIEQDCKLLRTGSDTVPSEVRLNSIHEQIVSAIQSID
jgi:hypothetical protein